MVQMVIINVLEYLEMVKGVIKNGLVDIQTKKSIDFLLYICIELLPKAAFLTPAQ